MSHSRHRAGKRQAKRDHITRRELAELLDVHPMTVTKWEQAGLPIAERGRAGKPSLYRAADVRTWLQQREEAAKSPDALDLVQERARKERAQAILAEQTYSIRERNLLPREEVERAWAAEVTAVRARLLSWSTTLCDQVYRVATLEGLPGVERILSDAVDEVLRELSAPTRANVRLAAKRKKRTRR